jgi:3-oxoacyl-[acyl-carrier protein] reductase
MNISLKDKTAIICGSTQGIGKAIAEEMARLGASCILIARNEDKLKEMTASLDRSSGQSHRYYVADFSDAGNVRKAATEIAAGGPVHILVNNTGGPAAGAIVEADPEAFLKACEQHLVCNHILVQAVIPSMKAAAYGRIINIISTSVKTPLRNLGVSNATRAAVASWAKTLSYELGRFNITVNNLLPGSINTQRIESLIAHTAEKRNTDKETIRKEMIGEIPMNRFGDTSEMAAVAAFLASPAASYVSGVSIPVDGGKTITLS